MGWHHALHQFRRGDSCSPCLPRWWFQSALASHRVAWLAKSRPRRIGYVALFLWGAGLSKGKSRVGACAARVARFTFHFREGGLALDSAELWYRYCT